MRNLGTLFVDSLQELKKVRSLVLTAMLIGLAIVLGSFGTIQIGEYLKIGFSFIPKVMIGFMFGPAVGMIAGGTTDLLAFIIKPTGPFFPGFTLVEMTAGLLYGFFLYKRKITVSRIIVTKAMVSLVCNIIMNTFFLVQLYGDSMLAALPLRVFKNLVALPIEIMLIYAVLIVMTQVKRVVIQE